ASCFEGIQLAETRIEQRKPPLSPSLEHLGDLREQSEVVSVPAPAAITSKESVVNASSSSQLSGPEPRVRNENVAGAYSSFTPSDPEPPMPKGYGAEVVDAITTPKASNSLLSCSSSSRESELGQVLDASSIKLYSDERPTLLSANDAIPVRSSSSPTMLGRAQTLRPDTAVSAPLLSDFNPVQSLNLDVPYAPVSSPFPPGCTAVKDNEPPSSTGSVLACFPSTNGAHTNKPFPEKVAPAFQPLVDVLVKYIANGVTRPLRSLVWYDLAAVGLVKALCAEAGVTHFNDYTALAEQEGIIQMGSSNSEDWISLKPVAAETNKSTPIHRPSGSTAPFVSRPSLKNVPPAFQPLVDVLEKHRAKGVMRPLRDTVMSDVVGVKTLYTNAGVKKFGPFAQLAMKARIIEMGSSDGKVWISFHRDLR
ncbi:hypothetical protein GGX14DRAFT_434512, partial [Mycena pura]